MRRILLTAAALALTTASAACGDDPTVVASDPTSATADPDEPVESPPFDGTLPGEEPSAELVEPRPGMADVGPQAFESAEELDDGRALVVRYWAGVAPCSVLGAVDVEETDEQVVVTLMVGSAPDSGDVACIEIAKLYETRVDLEQPLGDREIVDGAQ